MFVPYLVLAILVRTAFSKTLDEGCYDLSKPPTQPPIPKVISITQRGNLYSPGFERGENYPNSVQCSYQIQAPFGTHVRLKFNSLDIDASTSCAADSVMIFDFNSQGHGVLHSKYCGKVLPYDYVSKSYVMQVILVTNPFATRRGFNITYSVSYSADVCSIGMKECKNRNCVASAKVCDGNDDCGDGTDEEKCSRVSLETAVCGKPDINPVSFADYDRIVGGQKAVAGSWPWMADLQLKMTEPSHMCGGSLINAQWVVSAAHCFGGLGTRQPDAWRIHLGNYRKFDRDDSEQIRYVERIIIYDDIPSAFFEQNGQFDIVNDMALIKLSAPVKFTKYVKPVCIPDTFTKQPTMADKCYTTGWGMTRGSGSSDLLKQAYQPIQSGITCARKIGQQFKPQTMFCAGGPAALKGACHGDSGGPLVCEINKSWYLFGVTSFGTDGNGQQGGGFCGVENNPTIYNRVDVKKEWIQKMIDKYS